MAKHVKQVYGVELGEAAVADATHNAERNGVRNVEFICAKVEDALEEILRTKVSPTDEVVVVLDPPRCGVHNSVVELLRKTDAVRRLLYVACAAENEHTISNLYGWVSRISFFLFKKNLRNDGKKGWIFPYKAKSLSRNDVWVEIVASRMGKTHLP